MTTTTKFSSSLPHQAAYLVYINGIEVPATRVSMRYGVWQIPECQVSMVPDPVLTRLGNEDRVQLEVFYLDDTNVDPSVEPAFRLFFDGEITGWGYQMTSGQRSITFTAVNQMAIFTQLFVSFLTTFDDLVGHATLPGEGSTSIDVPTSQAVFPFSLFKQGIVPGQELSGGNVSDSIKFPGDFLYNVVRNMIGSQVPAEQLSVPAANFFTRWCRLTNFQNRFIGSPFFDEVDPSGANPNVFPVLKALQDVAGLDVLAKNLIPQVQTKGSIWDMLQLVYQTTLMEVAMIPSMPLVKVNLPTNLVLPTAFNVPPLQFNADYIANGKQVPGGAYTAVASDSSRATAPLRIPNYFAKPQFLFGIPPSCNVVFPSQLKMLSYDEVFATQPTRMYFNDETLIRLFKMSDNGNTTTIHNALTLAYPPALDDEIHDVQQAGGRFNNKNILLWPEEFFKGPVMDRREVPPWLFFLKANQLNPEGKKSPIAQVVNAVSNFITADGGVTAPPRPAQTAAVAKPKPIAPPGAMVTQSNIGFIGPNGNRVYRTKTQALQAALQTAITGTSIPLTYIMTWINMESGGDPRSTDGDGALGIFQLLPDNARSIRSKTFPNGVTDPKTVLVSNPLNNDPTNALAIQAGVDYILNSRIVADTAAKRFGLTWSDGDMWRLTKGIRHDLPGFFLGTASTPSAIAQATASLGHPPKDWDEFYHAVVNNPPLGGLGLKALNNATAVGTVPGCSGTMLSAEDPKPFTAPGATPAPRAAAGASSPTPPAPPAPGATSAEQDATAAAVANASPGTLPDAGDVYHLYAKYEYFRERYARRNGSAQLVWNPYIVPGFPAQIFDHRSSRVDLACYITTVQQDMTATGQRSTNVSFLYGRQLQEQFDLMAKAFAAGEPSMGSAPADPVRDVRKIIQSFTQAETFYTRLFYGGNQLFNKPASFDFRNVIGYAPLTPNGPVETIIVNGPEEASQDTYAAAQAQLILLYPEQKSLEYQIAQLTQTQTSAASQVSTLDPTTSSPTAFLNAQAQKTVNTSTAQAPLLQFQLDDVNRKIQQYASIVQDTQDVVKNQQVTHNLVGDREIVPLPTTETLFNNYDAAMIYAWRPICSLDEYVAFHNSGGEGLVPAFGHSESLGAPYYARIRRLLPTTAAAAAAPIQPPGADGVRTTRAPGLDQTFPQTRADWDDALIAYRNNVRYVKAPRV